MTFSSLSKSFVRLFPVCLFGMAAVLVPGSAEAQKFEELPLAEKYQMVEVDEDAEKEEKKELSRINRDARAARKTDLKAVQALLASGGNVNVAATQEYFDGFVFPSMTMAKNLTKAGKLRYDFDRTYMGTKFTGASRVPFIQDVVLPRLKTIAENESLLPAARVNAVVMIGRLDDSPLIRTTKRAPRPSLEAFDTLIGIWQGQSPDFLKAAAFSGILRHMEIDAAITTPRIANDKKSQLMRAVTASVDKIVADDPELKVDLNRWKVSKSIWLMGKAGLASETGAYFDRLSAMLAKESKIPTWVKFEALRGLSRMPLEGTAPGKINSLIELSVSYASQSLGEEAADLDVRVEALIFDNILWDNNDLEVNGTNYIDAPTAPTGNAGMGMMGGGGGMGAGGMGMGMDAGGRGGGGGRGAGGGGGGRGPGGGGGGRGPGGGGSRGGGMGMGMGGMGGMGMGMPGEEPLKPFVELPNYELNLSRRRMKLIAFNVQKLLSLKPVQDTATDRHKDSLETLEARLEEFINEDSSIGIIDLGKKGGDDEEQTESYTMQLKSAFENMSRELADSVSKMRGEAVKAAGAAAGEAPEADPFDESK